MTGVHRALLAGVMAAMLCSGGLFLERNHREPSGLTGSGARVLAQTPLSGSAATEVSNMPAGLFINLAAPDASSGEHSPSPRQSTICGTEYHYVQVVGGPYDHCYCFIGRKAIWGCGDPPLQIPSGGMWPGCVEGVTVLTQDAGYDCGAEAICGPAPGWWCAGSPGPTCGNETCGSSAERCDGQDNDEDGQSDEGVCEPDGPCQNYRTDPVDVGSGAFFTHPAVDVRFEGSSVPMEFVRRYTSMDAWPPRGPTRIGVGWFHTYDERLFGSDARSQADPSFDGKPDRFVVHRTSSGRGRRFTCGLADASGVFRCTTVDGSLDELRWRPEGPEGPMWELVASDGVTTSFAIGGHLLRKNNTRGQGWKVVYYADGPLDGRMHHVEDHLGRQILFEFEAGVDNPRLVGLSVGERIASFEYLPGGLLLRSAQSAAGNEEYEYFQKRALVLQRDVLAKVWYPLPVIERQGEDEYGCTSDYRGRGGPSPS